ncbi:unnamed protein product [Boreogadus saida]
MQRAEVAVTTLCNIRRTWFHHWQFTESTGVTLRQARVMDSSAWTSNHTFRTPEYISHRGQLGQHWSNTKQHLREEQRRRGTDAPHSS